MLVCLVESNVDARDPLINSSNPTTWDSQKQKAIISRWENASRAIDSALDRLHFLAAVIRKASARQLEYNVATFLTDDDIVFRSNAASLVRWRFPNARRTLCEQLGNAIAVRRRMLLHKHHHALKLTVRRLVPEAVPSTRQSGQDPEPRSSRPGAANPRLMKMTVRPLNVPASGITKASTPDPQAPVLRYLHHPPRPALTSVISTISAAPGDSFEYPPPPQTKQGETRVQCPYCLMPLDLGELEKRGDEYWKQHVDEDLKPYICLFPECAEALVFFTRRREWKSHMETVHSRDWPRKVHTITWFCDLDHEPPELFETASQWRNHMQNLDSHPTRRLGKPTTAQLDALSPRKQQVALREHLVCPLCENIPDRIRPLEAPHMQGQGQGPVKGTRADDMMMYEVLVDHVANHIKSLSLLSLPCLDDDNTIAPLDAVDGDSMEMEDSFRRIMNVGSVPQPPSGIDYLEEVSLPPEVWSKAERDEIAQVVKNLPESELDKEYLHYVDPDDIPDSLDVEWDEKWKMWKTLNDPRTQESIDSDPVIMHLRNARIAAGSEQETTHTIIPGDGYDIERKDKTSQIRFRIRLLKACGTGDSRTVSKLLEEGADIETKDQYNQTPLSWASAKGHRIIVKMLLERGADLESHDSFEQTPLLRAAKNGHKAVVSLLLEKDAETESKDIMSQTPLLWAAENGHEDVVRLLVEKWADIESKDNLHRTPLLRAASNGHEATVNLLLEKGADLESEDTRKETPLFRAAKNGHEAVVRVLVAKGAHLESKNIHKETPILWAAKNGHKAVVELLLEKGVHVESQDTFHQTILSWAAANGHEAVVELLLEKGAYINSCDKFIRTPLIWAAKNGHIRVVMMLLQKGADPYVEDNAGRTSLQWASEKGHEAIVDLFQNYIDVLTGAGP